MANLQTTVQNLSTSISMLQSASTAQARTIATQSSQIVALQALLATCPTLQSPANGTAVLPFGQSALSSAGPNLRPSVHECVHVFFEMHLRS